MQLLTTFNSALGFRRYLFGAIITIAIAAFDWAKEFAGPRVAGSQMQDLIGVPSWVAGIVVAVGFILFHLLRYATELRQEIEPRVKIQFEPEGGCIVATPKIGELQGQKVKWNAIFVRGLVITDSKVAVKECSAYLIGVTKKGLGGVFEPIGYFDGLPMPWSNSEDKTTIRVVRGMKRYFDILNISERTPTPQFPFAYPLRLFGLFDQPGTYRLSVLVTADGASDTAEIEVTWGPTWRDWSGTKVNA